MAHPQISLPRHNSPDGAPSFGPTTAGPSASAYSRSSRQPSLTTPRILKRALKFPQMDFELAVWEMTSLLLSPKRVFKNYHYHRATQRTWHRPDPSFTYLLAFFMLLTGLGWGFAYGRSTGHVFKIPLMFVVLHLLVSSLAVATVMFVLVGRVLGSGVVASLPTFLTGRRRQRGLFGQAGGEAGAEQLEFGYCFDVAIRAFFPVWVFLYVVQFVLMPVIARQYWASLFVGNSLYLLAGGYYTVITFLGYNGEFVFCL
jgi:hypothetical protein